MVTSAKPLHPGIRRERREGWGRFWRKESVKGWLFVSPWVIGFLFLYLGPLVSVTYFSFTDYNVFDVPYWTGFANYIRLFTKDPVFLKVCENMLIYTLASTVLSIVGGLIYALLLDRPFAGNHFFRTILYVPSLLASTAAIGIMFKQIFSTGDFGLANQFLGIFRISPLNWLSNYDFPQLALFAVVLVNFWFIGGTMLPFLVGLKGISPTYYEAARLDGAGSWRLFRYITMPLLSPVIVYNTVITLIVQLQVFAIPLAFASSGLLTSTSNPLGYRNSLGTFLTYLYVSAFVKNEFGYGSTLSIIILCITLLLTLLVLWVSRRFTYYAAN